MRPPSGILLGHNFSIKAVMLSVKTNYVLFAVLRINGINICFFVMLVQPAAVKVNGFSSLVVLHIVINPLLSTFILLQCTRPNYLESVDNVSTIMRFKAIKIFVWRRDSVCALWIAVHQAGTKQDHWMVRCFVFLMLSLFHRTAVENVLCSITCIWTMQKKKDDNRKVEARSVTLKVLNHWNSIAAIQVAFSEEVGYESPHCLWFSFNHFTTFLVHL